MGGLLALALLAAACPASFLFLPWQMASTTCASLICVLVGLFALARPRDSFVGLTSLLLGFLTPPLIIVPAHGLLAGERTSRLAQLGMTGLSPEQAHRALVLFAVCLVAVALGEAVCLLSRPGSATPHLDMPAARTAARAWLVLIVMGLPSVLLADVGVEALRERGQAQGAGVQVLISLAWPAAAVLAVLFRHWHSRLRLGVTVGTLLLSVVVTGARSPLTVVVAALLLRVVAGLTTRQALRLFPVALVGLYVVLVGVQVFAEARDSIAYGTGLERTTLVDIATDPLAGIATRGAVDTFDGAVLAMRADPDRVGATPFDPFKAVTTFVPRQLWPDKPNFLAPEVTHAYTDFTGLAGIFLSGPGYAYLVYAGMPGGAVAFFLIGLLAGRYTRRHRPILSTLITYAFVRFYFAGDAFDFFYAAQIGLLIGGAHIVVALTYRGVRAPEAAGSPRTLGAPSRS